MNQAQSISHRRVDLDWLRVLAILVVFIFHSAHFFDLGDWHVKNSTTYFGVAIGTAILADWMMPLIFVISGASLFYAITKGGAGKFIKDKVLRLAVPLLVGIFTHAAWMVYLERTTHHQFFGTFWEFIPQYFQGLYGFGAGNFAWMGLHLWYLLILFVFSLLLYPLFRWLRTSGSGLLTSVCEFLARPGMVYLLALPGMLLISVLDPRDILGQRGFGGWSFVIYIPLFIYGFAIIANDHLQQRIMNLRWVSLLSAIASTLACFFVHGTGSDPAFGTPEYVYFNGLYALASWFWVLAILGFGMRHLTQPAPFLQYANEAVLPFYVMHQTVLLTIGYFVVSLPVPDLVKWVAIVVISFSIIIGLYEFLVKRFNLLRFLFGMKPLQRAPSTAGQPATLVSGR